MPTHNRKRKKEESILPIILDFLRHDRVVVFFCRLRHSVFPSSYTRQLFFVLLLGVIGAGDGG